MSLHTTDLGERGSRVVFCHGLFGQGRNWTQIGKQLAGEHRVTLVDMPHHGRSSWPEEFDYVDVADRVARLLDGDPWTQAADLHRRLAYVPGDVNLWPNLTGGEVIDLLGALEPRQWRRAGIHLARGRMELAEWVASLAGHDDNHLEQLRRAVDGRP